MRRPQTVDVQLIINEYKNGKYISQISREYGFNISSIKRVLNSLELKDEDFHNFILNKYRNETFEDFLSRDNNEKNKIYVIKLFDAGYSFKTISVIKNIKQCEIEKMIYDYCFQSKNRSNYRRYLDQKENQDSEFRKEKNMLKFDAYVREDYLETFELENEGTFSASSSFLWYHLELKNLYLKHKKSLPAYLLDLDSLVESNKDENNCKWFKK